ncbi:MAG: class I SAM-dependent methyltransferase [Actinomycetota bacterium]|nr:class I SAM-dependent methyltransferase [Actinomycetota bacterium]
MGDVTAIPRLSDAPAAYTTNRPEVTALVPRRCQRVLDVGCSTGEVGAALRADGHDVTGIEVNPRWAEQAQRRLDTVITADIEALAGTNTDVGGPFDCVVMADILEHLRDPWLVVRWVAGLLSPAGCVVVSLPNVRHLHLVAQVLLGRRWPYDDAGIFDRTHLRWFAYRNVAELVEGPGLHVTALTRHFGLVVEPRSRLGLCANRIAPLLGDLGTLQFVFRAEPAGTGSLRR